MNLLNHKRAEAITLIFFVLIIVLFLGWLINFNSKECRSNSDCNSDSYCGSDFSCHQIPTVEKTIVKNNLIVPSIIISIAIILGALILKSSKFRFFKKNTQEIIQETKQDKPKDTIKLP